MCIQLCVLVYVCRRVFAAVCVSIAESSPHWGLCWQQCWLGHTEPSPWYVNPSSIVPISLGTAYLHPTELVQVQSMHKLLSTKHRDVLLLVCAHTLSYLCTCIHVVCKGWLQICVCACAPACVCVCVCACVCVCVLCAVCDFKLVSVLGVSGDSSW